MSAAVHALPALGIAPARLSESEVADTLGRLERAREALRVAERDAARHGTAANNLTGLACLLQLVAAELDVAHRTVVRASLRA